ncbi:MAG: hypothetical protein DHS20C18_39150 [Saprospiraceae bacterium]|nr:MAG: hypothetical protein DHS20C18_39150 [Saprospiraceae bacterium]
MTQTASQKKKVYFPNLNGLRFIAALLVILHHVEQLKLKSEMTNRFHEPFFTLCGRLGVVLFFVLSGFLITYLLLVEQKETGKIAIKSFYIRRALRIWPLYYLIVFLGLFVLPGIPFLELPGYTEHVGDNFILKVGLFLFMLPNVALVLLYAVPYASQTWTIGVEEQFYLFWPHLIKRSNKVITALLGVIMGYWLIRVCLFTLLHYGFDTPAVLTHLSNFFAGFNIDCMAIGGIAAYLFFKGKKKILWYLYSLKVQIPIGVLTLVLVLNGVGVFYPVYAVLFAIIILNAATNPNNIFLLENRLLNYLGKISYGLYMYHSIAIGITMYLLSEVRFFNDPALYLLSMILTVLISGLSYHFFEEKFIRRKHKFSKVLSGELAKE